MHFTKIFDDILKLPEHHPVIGNCIELNCIDYLLARINTGFALVYANETAKELNIGRLKSSLIDTLTEYPELTASLKVEKKILLVHSNTGIRFSAYKTDLSYQDFVSMKSDETPVFFPVKSCFDIDISNQFLCYIKVTVLKDKSYIIGFSINHALQDAHSIFQFVNAWSYRFLNPTLTAERFGKYKNCIFSERELLKEYKAKRKCIEYQINVKEPNSDAFKSSKSVLISISKDKLQKMKKEYLKHMSSGDPSFLSCNDIMCSVLFKAITKAKKLSNATDLKLGMVVNVRKRLGFSENFSGNAIVAKGIPVTVEEVEKMQWWKLAALIRNNVSNFNANEIKGKLGLLASSEDWSKCKWDFDLSKDTYFINWESFPVFTPDFGSGNPKSLIYFAWCYGMVVFLPTSRKDITQAILNVTAEQIQTVIDDQLLKKIIA